MSEEKKSKLFSTAVKVIAGLIFIFLGIAAIISWWDDFWIVIRGCIGLFLFLAGIIIIIIAKE